MLNLEDKKKTYTTDCISCLALYFIARSCDNDGLEVIMSGITEEQEKDLDNGKIITINTELGCFNVDPAMCYCYGKLDLSPNSKDINRIYEAHWFDNFHINIYLVSEYNYATHSVTSDKPGGRWYESSNPRNYIPYLHGCIGKPKRVVIFKNYSRKFEIKNKKKVKKQSTKTYNKEQHQIKMAARKADKISKLKFGLNI